MPERSFESASRSRATLAPLPITGEELRKGKRAMTDEKLGTDSPTLQDLDVSSFPRHGEPEEELIYGSERLRQKENNMNYHISIALGLNQHDLP